MRVVRLLSQSEQIKEITEKLEKGITELFESDSYKEYLKCMSRFTSYSLNNMLLIAMQKPDATAVAGYSTWKQMHRQVKKGEKAIKIIAPCPYRKKVKAEVTDEQGRNILGTDGKPLMESEEKVIMGFRVVNVFDVSSTEGEPLPEIAHKLDGTVEGYTDFMDALQQFSPVPIIFREIEGSANGYYHPADKNIVIDESMSQEMHIKTGIHEITHALLHDKDNRVQKDSMPDRETKEIQAESVAFTVCQYYGIDTSGYSFGYIAGWASGKDLKELKSSMETIRQTSQAIISGVDKKLEVIKQSKHIQMNDKVLKCNMSDITTKGRTANKSRKL